MIWEMEEMNCPHCQSTQKDDARFCNNCGLLLAKEELTSGTLLDNRYEILELIKKGGMGALYRVKDHRLMDTSYALKEMLDNFDTAEERAEAITWFKREAEILCRELRHPNIPVVKDFFIEKGKYYLVMDFINGKNLEHQPLPMDEKSALEFALTALDILIYLHKKNIIHRDIKPENFMIEDESKKLFLVDFGTATLFSSKKTKTAIGTVGYASPEHYEGKQDERSDIYSFGATCYRVITGVDPKIRAPFDFQPLRDVNPKISEAFAHIVEKAIQYKPADRYQSAAEMKEALTNLTRPQQPALPAQPPQVQPEAPFAVLSREYSTSYKIHGGKVHDLAFSPDGAVIASAGGDAAVRLFNIFTGKEECSWSDHKAEVRAVTFSPDGKWIASGSGDSTVKARERMPNGKTITLIGHSEKVTSVLFSPGGTLLASGSQDMKVCFWETATWKKLDTVGGHRSSITDLAFSPKGKILATASADGKINLLDSKTRNINATLALAPGRICSIAFYPADNYPYLACGLEDGSIRIWDIKKGTPVTRIDGHRAQVTGVAFSADGKLLASGSEDRQVRIWDNQGRCVLTLPEHQEKILSIGISPDGRILAAGSDDGQIRLFNLPELIGKSLQKKVDTPRALAARAKPSASTSPMAQITPPREGQGAISPAPNRTAAALNKTPENKSGDRPLMTLEGHPDGAECLSFTSDSRILAAGSGDGSIKIWDLSAGREITCIKKSEKSLWGEMSDWLKGSPSAHSESVTSVFFLPGDNFLISTSCDYHLIVWRYPIGKGEKNTFAHTHELFCGALSGNGEHLAAGSKGEILLFVVKAGGVTKVTTLESGKEWINSLSWSPEGKILGSGDEKGTLSLWNIGTGKLLKEFPQHSRRICAVSFSGDGKKVATGSEDSTIKILDLNTLTSPMTLEQSEAGENAVIALRFSPCGRYLASAGEDGRARLWDPSSGNLITILGGHEKRINDCAFSPDKKVMATGSEDGTVKVWELPA